ncbi:hypothetical protein [Mesorhizobium sp. M0006]|uniref:hypothetical protein n=1 Tax=unclassified Mesorhizobium TaxID=325217 RepID=UPI0033356022
MNKTEGKSTGSTLPETIKGVRTAALPAGLTPLLHHWRAHISSGDADSSGMGIAAALVQRSTGAPR